MIKYERKLVPNFLIIGSMKSGTTSLYDDLSSSKQFFLPENKKPHILLSDKSDEAIFKLYYKHFRNSHSEQILGEASTTYTFTPIFPHVAKHAQKICGENLKLIMIMRDPLERILSHLRHDFAVGRLRHTDFDRALHNDPRYIAVSDYYEQLKKWIEVFGSSNLLCISFNDFFQKRLETVQRACIFLGGDPSLITVSSVASNRSADLLKSYSSAFSSIPNSTIYSEYVRKLIPSGLRETLKNALISKQPHVEVMLSDESVNFIREHFFGLEKNLVNSLNRQLPSGGTIKNPTKTL